MPLSSTTISRADSNGFDKDAWENNSDETAEQKKQVKNPGIIAEIADSLMSKQNVIWPYLSAWSLLFAKWQPIQPVLPVREERVPTSIC